MDTIVGKDQKSALVVATERKTKLTRIRKIENFKAEDTAKMVIAMLRKYKKWVHTAYRTKKVLFPRTNFLLDKIGATHHQKQRNNP